MYSSGLPHFYCIFFLSFIRFFFRCQKWGKIVLHRVIWCPQKVQVRKRKRKGEKESTASILEGCRYSSCDVPWYGDHFVPTSASVWEGEEGSLWTEGKNKFFPLNQIENCSLFPSFMKLSQISWIFFAGNMQSNFLSFSYFLSCKLASDSTRTNKNPKLLSKVQNLISIIPTHSTDTKQNWALCYFNHLLFSSSVLEKGTECIFFKNRMVRFLYASNNFFFYTWQFFEKKLLQTFLKWIHLLALWYPRGYETLYWKCAPLELEEYLQTQVDREERIRMRSWGLILLETKEEDETFQVQRKHSRWK